MRPGIRLRNNGIFRGGTHQMHAGACFTKLP
jgi:hypothetical protein